MYGQYQSTPINARDGDSAQVRITEDRKLVVAVGESVAPVPIGATTWTHTPVTLTGASQQIAPANAARTGLIIQNRTGNSAFAINLAGATAALVGGIAIAAGTSKDLLGATCPANAVTGIGTAAQVVDVYEGTAS